MRNQLLSLLFIALLSNFSIAQETQITNTENISRILNTLASDDMRGRSALNINDIGKAADFIANEFKEIGLKPYAEETFRQSFIVERSKVTEQNVKFGKKNLPEDEFLIWGDLKGTITEKDKNTKQYTITDEQDFSQEFRNIVQKDTSTAVILVGKKHAPLLARFKKIYNREQVKFKDQNTLSKGAKVFIIADGIENKYNISQKKDSQEFSMFNVAGIIPGKSKPDEFVIISCHYDHIGIIQPVEQDSIANGADDDASGTTAMIELARYYKKLNNNERTLIFVAFTGEEIGMFGSKYFSNNIDPEKVVAMINIEMIGKDSKFGPNSLYITGYEASNLGKLMQENLKGSAFTFHPDPYTTQNLFYRSDNAVLAALGVPAHTFSTSQIDKDQYYHTVKDEVSTLDINNIKSSIEAIATGAIGIINGSQTPSRVEKLRD
ncbi:M28 family metallopeptidase [Sphingobacterium daejeonense]|uniref:M28 family metallopeptidase n=1 Tax=Sphingobacterium daejeonense TaxID=371142 RepID=UPI0010C5B511|nr:M20/M25/M40 family metallo-hydrolase [Sphingobacterium daejeonense]VTP86131.1 Bacterial leucyl aminopeptidase precursor [Sphingobacterium daejeonense]